MNVWLRRRNGFAISILITLMVVFILKNQTNSELLKQSVNRLTVLGHKDFPGIQPLDCLMSYPILGVMAKICVKKDDLHVSKKILEDGAWEEDIVALVMKAMRFYEEAVFIDAGSNIGMYTLMVAAMGREVLAVDMMSDNLAYIRRSLELENREHLVTLAYNAVSDNHKTVYPVQFDNNSDPLQNPGSLRATGVEELLLTKKKPLGPGVQSVTLPDIFNTISAETVILKMDIQGYECKALMTPGVFAPSHFIPYIFMEWSLISNSQHEASLCSNREALIDLLKYQGYIPMKLSPLGLVPDSCLNHGIADMLWVHESARPLQDPVIPYPDCH